LILAHSDVELPVVRAWRMVQRRSRVEQVEVLKAVKKSAVYRLTNVGPGPSTVVAKRSWRPSIDHEYHIYRDVLPTLGVPALQCYGFVDDEFDDGQGWIFLEDAGGGDLVPPKSEFCRLLASWLAAVHSGSTGYERAVSLPDRGPAHYLERLRSARRRILGNIDNAWFTATDTAILSELVAQCALIERHWQLLEKACAGIPRTLVHGDLAPKNARLRQIDQASILLIMDWEMAGWGIPAADLGLFSRDAQNLETYRRLMKTWPHLTEASAHALADAGLIFLLLVWLDWETGKLQLESAHTRTLCHYRDRLAQILETSGWNH
jgi:aminoglycoside phosphotransferase (APT) family kinase protein